MIKVSHTRHSLEQAEKRNISTAQIKDVLANGEIWPDHQGTAGVVQIEKDGIRLIVSTTNRKIITAEWIWTTGRRAGAQLIAKGAGITLA